MVHLKLMSIFKSKQFLQHVKKKYLINWKHILTEISMIANSVVQSAAAWTLFTVLYYSQTLQQCLEQQVPFADFFCLPIFCDNC